jgi:dihydroorotate dehydrogenase
MYRISRSIFFAFDAEKVHYFAMNTLRWACKVGILRRLLEKIYQPKNTIPTNLFGLRFSNPIGLGAGFDKNAQYLQALSVLGFGFVEIGTVTPLPQDGNEKPRLFRLPKDKALINRMGFNNNGAPTIAQSLSTWRNQHPNSSLIIGGNIGKNKATPNEYAWKDYLMCFETLYDQVDYFVVNVSSPNTPGLRALQEKDSLLSIFSALHQSRTQQSKWKPILLKIAPDLSKEQVDEILVLSNDIHLDGIIVSNTTIERENLVTDKKTIEKIGAGGLSGLPLQNKSSELIKYIHTHTQGQLPIIGSGGVFTGKDAVEKLQAGASLVQVWTGFIYEGPCIVRKINRWIHH